VDSSVACRDITPAGRWISPGSHLLGLWGVNHMPKPPENGFLSGGASYHTMRPDVLVDESVIRTYLFSSTGGESIGTSATEGMTRQHDHGRGTRENRGSINVMNMQSDDHKRGKGMVERARGWTRGSLTHKPTHNVQHECAPSHRQ
jgi:hypothetical protein